ncbi:MAG: hypothetical protein L3K00_07340 [Thermoplasmata archaeon]|nr:hypothetical protein [Thermoplasmata archaeon]
MDATEFQDAIRGAPTPGERLAWFGALLARESKSRVEIVGDSAIEIRLSSDVYVSQDVDVVGNRNALAIVLRRWSFREVAGRSQRVYWFLPDIGLVDLVGTVARSGLPPDRMDTPFGPVWLSAVEPLIVRRLVRYQRERARPLYLQALLLAKSRPIDWEYLEAEANYEEAGPVLARLRRDAGRRRATVPRGRRRTPGSREGPRK